MTFYEAWRVQATPTFDPEKTQRLFVGAMMPFWAPMAVAAAAGAAFWSLSRWMRLAAPEAVLEAEADAGPKELSTVDALAVAPIPEVYAEAAAVPSEPEVFAAPPAEPGPIEQAALSVEPAETAVAAAMEVVDIETPKIAEAMAAPIPDATAAAPRKSSSGPKAQRKRPVAP